jgi:O-antigen ligase
MRKKVREIADEDFYALKIGMMWRYFKGESFAFWMICAYLFFEYVRPQSIIPAIDFLPWTQLTIIGAFLGCFADRTVRWVSSSINVLLILFLVVILLSSVFAYFPSFSYAKLENYYLWVIIYFLIINIVNTRKRFFIFLCVFLLASSKLSLSLALTWAKRGFSFTDWGLSGPPGFFQNSGELAIQMLVFWPIAWAFAHSLKPYVSKRWYRLLMLMPITAIMVILGSSSRGGQLALVVQLVVMNYRTVFKPKILISCCVAFFLIWTFLPEQQKERFQTMGEDKTSRQRILYWENGLEMIQEHPVLGVGYFNFVPYFERYYSEDVLFHRAELPHNIIIQVGTDTGAVGLTIFLALLFVALRKAQRFRAKGCETKQRLIGNCANLSLIGFFVAGQFVTVTYYPFLWIHLALLVSLQNSFSENLRQKIGRS